MFEPSPPPAPPSPFETTPPDQLTVHQFLSLHLQLMSIAPSGFMLTQHFTDTLLSISNKAVSMSSKSAKFHVPVIMLTSLNGYNVTCLRYYKCTPACQLMVAVFFV